jgi:Sulfocyanin (SoxE) domain
VAGFYASGERPRPGQPACAETAIADATGRPGVDRRLLVPLSTAAGRPETRPFCHASAMAAARFAAAGVVVSVALVAAACGASRPLSVKGSQGKSGNSGQAVNRAKLPPPRQFLAVDTATHTVTVTLIAAYDGANNGFNFDGYSRLLMWTVPRGWKVRVVCTNRGPLRHSCAVVRDTNSTIPAFRGAATPQPQIGLEAGHTASFAFRASTPGIYRFACLVPGHEGARMWDVFQIIGRGKPSVVDLQAK